MTAYHTCCAACADAIRIWPQQTCHLCGSVISVDIVPGPCGRCLRKPPPQVHTESLYTYAGPVRASILAWKLRGDDAGLQWLMAAAGTRLTTIFSPEDVLLPLPMPIARMRKAGRHHAADLCKAICKVTGSQMDFSVLRRSGAQHRQSSLSRTQRWNNLRKVFRVNSDFLSRLHLDAGRRLWVVDDIRTTGATLHYACRALKPAGHPVHAFSLARIADKE